MCTVSWLHHEQGYELFCNRDEKRTRAPALGPEIHTQNGVRFVAPTDGARGGAWIGTNQFGFSVCLLNADPRREEPGRSYTSRGLLLPRLLAESSIAGAGERVWQSDLSPFAPFTLVILGPGRQTCLFQWNGQDKIMLPCGDRHMPLVSSSFDPKGVRSKRHGEFQRLFRAAGEVDRNLLLGFHGSHGRAPDAYSPCMHRPDAETVSFSWVTVTGAEVRFYYSPGAPCCRRPGELRTLPLAG
jgi:hypothetical protein